MFELDPIETRVLGCLLEKQRTTPDTYPLTLNALRLACNQSTNRDPVFDFGEIEIQEALQRLHRRELTRVASGHTSRASKYRHLVDDKLGVGVDEMAVLCVLLLRGAQTPGELKQRTERLHVFTGLEDLETTAEHLIDRGLVERLERRPGEKQARLRHLLGADDPVLDATANVSSAIDAPTLDAPISGTPASLADQVASLTETVSALAAEVLALRASIASGGSE